MNWEDVEDTLLERFPPDVKRLTKNRIVKWLFGLAKVTSDDAWICEIGTLYGSLTAAMALACADTNKRVFTIDHMIGGYCMDMSLREPCIYLDFVDSMISLGVWDKVVPFPMRSNQADHLLLLMGAQFELIYLDGDHSYENVLSELVRYSCFLKPGGIICGDDCNAEQRPFYESFLYNKSFFEPQAVAKAMLEFFDGNDDFEPIIVPTNQFGFRKL